MCEFFQTKRAFLAWQEPWPNKQRMRHRVAEISQADDEKKFLFRYLKDDELFKLAEQKGFDGYVGLPMDDDLDALSYRARDLLIRRLPPRRREDFAEFIGQFGLDPDHEKYTDLTLLARTGARLARDGFSIWESFDGFECPFTYVFDVAGYRGHADKHRDIKAGDVVIFSRDRDSPDGHRDAIKMERGGEVLGYVNRFQAEKIGQWLDEGVTIDAKVYRVNGLSARPRAFVCAVLRSPGE